MIQPRTLKGFRDYLPETMLPREQLIETCKRVYRSFGFAPIDTPTLELFEILAGKGSEETDRQMYHFQDAGDRHVGMRFDLTVPLARFVAQHSQQLGMPFKRYHIATVWRGESPQAGRYREFMQCDFDTIGTTSLTSDIETGLVIVELLRAIGFERFQVRVNNRKVLNGLLQAFELGDKATPVLRAIDKLPKVGAAKVTEELRETAKATEQQINSILEFAQISGNNDEVLAELNRLAGGNELATTGIEQLRELVGTYQRLGLSDAMVQIDPSIARGLDYYTGTIFETFLNDLPGIGSVCSGGRYDNLADMFTREQLPGIGASLGLDRLLAAMEQLGLRPQTQTPAQVMVANFGDENRDTYFAIASSLRKCGLNVEMYPDSKKLGAQFKHADRRGVQAVLIAGSDEIASGKIQVKWMDSGEQTEVPWDNSAKELADYLLQKLN
ncbi:MAG: histidine--tRNA ligase [Pirellulaceae bacterium]